MTAMEVCVQGAAVDPESGSPPNPEQRQTPRAKINLTYPGTGERMVNDNIYGRYAASLPVNSSHAEGSLVQVGSLLVVVFLGSCSLLMSTD